MNRPYGGEAKAACGRKQSRREKWKIFRRGGIEGPSGTSVPTEWWAIRESPLRGRSQGGLRLQTERKGKKWKIFRRGGIEGPSGTPVPTQWRAIRESPLRGRSQGGLRRRRNIGSLPQTKIRDFCQLPRQRELVCAPLGRAGRKARQLEEPHRKENGFVDCTWLRHTSLRMTSFSYNRMN